MRGKERKFTPQYNLAVIRLIRQKFMPLQKTKASIHKSQQSINSYHKSKYSKTVHVELRPSFPTLESFKQTVLAERSENQSTILQRARQYLQSNRREGDFKEKVHLKEYIQLFEKPVEIKGRNKRESIQFDLLTMESRTRLQPLARVSLCHETLELNQEELSILNAKIRRKFNHKKIIDLGKRCC